MFSVLIIKSAYLSALIIVISHTPPFYYSGILSHVSQFCVKKSENQSGLYTVLNTSGKILFFLYEYYKNFILIKRSKRLYNI